MNQGARQKIYPPTILCVLLIMQIAAHFLLPLKQIISAPFSYGGVLLIIFGAVINLWADKIFKQNNTTVKPDGKPSQLIIKGPFRFTRHPMYLGMVAILLGTAILFGSTSAMIFPIIFFLVIHYKFIPMEEMNMNNEFGKNYLDYKKSARKWL